MGGEAGQKWPCQAFGIEFFQSAVSIASICYISWPNKNPSRFPDFTHHNANVFSMIDRFEYGKSEKLESATASYQVIGWHSQKEDDPFFIGAMDNNSSHKTIVDGCKLTFSTLVKDGNEVVDWLKSKASTRVLCHGSMYNVEYSASGQPKHAASQQLSTLVNSASPVAIGTTPLDASLAFLGAHIPTASDDEKIMYKDLQAL